MAAVAGSHVALLTVLRGRGITLASDTLLTACQDIITEFGLPVDAFANELDALGDARVTDAALRALRQQLAKRSKGVRRPAAAAGGTSFATTSFSTASAAISGTPGAGAPAAGGSPWTPPTKFDKSSVAAMPGYSAVAPATMSGRTGMSALSASTPVGPGRRPGVSASFTASPSTASTAGLYAARDNAGQVTDTYNRELPDVAAPFARPSLAEVGQGGFLLLAGPAVLRDAPGLLQLPKITSTKPLPLVFPCLDRYGRFADVKLGGDAAWREAQAAAMPVTYSRAYLEGLRLVAAAGSPLATRPGAGAGAAAPTATSPSAPTAAADAGAGAAAGGEGDGGGAAMEGLDDIAGPASGAAAAASAASPAPPASPMVGSSGSAAPAIEVAPLTLQAVSAGFITRPGDSPGIIPSTMPSHAAAGAGSAWVSSGSSVTSSQSSGMDLVGEDSDGGSDAATATPLRPIPDVTALVSAGLVRADRFMFTTPDMRAAALQARIDDLGTAMVAKYRLAEEMVPVGTRSDTPVVYVGRVCVATEAGDGKINATSVLLEGIMADGGKRVALDLSELGGFSLFPGQVIAVRGINAVGYRMVVQALYHGIAAPPPVMRACNARAVAQAAMKAGGGPLRVWTAVGPYCCHSDLTFQPLRDLLTEATAAATPPDVLVLMGPFIDAEHPAVKSGDLVLHDGATAVMLTVHELMEARVVAMLESALRLPQLAKTSLVLVPAYTDATSMPVHPLWPLTPEIASFQEADVRERVVLAPNPGTFIVGGLVFAATSTDVLFQLNRDETTRLAPGVPGGGPKLDRIARLTQHMLEQRSLFPMYPAPASESEAGVPLEPTWMPHLALTASPDVLIVPSKLKAFARPFGTTLAVNPGLLTRGNAGGTYARLAVFPSAKHAALDAASAALDGTYVLQDVPSRTKVEVVRI